MHLEYRVPENDYGNLESLVGLRIDELAFQSASESKPTRLAHMVAVKDGQGGFVRFCTDEWDDTEKEAINCFRLRIQKVNDPAYAYQSKSGDPVKIEHVSFPGFVVDRIEVFEFRDSEAGESVTYDAGILLNGSSSQRVFIGVNESSIAGDVYFLLSAEEIENALARFNYVQSFKSA